MTTRAIRTGFTLERPRIPGNYRLPSTPFTLVVGGLVLLVGRPTVAA